MIMISHHDAFGNTHRNLNVASTSNVQGVWWFVMKSESPGGAGGGREGRGAGPQVSRCLNTRQVRVEVQQQILELQSGTGETHRFIIPCLKGPFTLLGNYSQSGFIRVSI